MSYSPLENAEEGLTLTFDQTSGAEGAGVTYNPNEHLYYAITGGNAFMLFETFDTLGNSLNQINAGYFALGLWWNPQLNQQGNNWQTTS